MAILVNKTFLVDTNDVDEAYALTKPTSDKVGTFAVGQIRPYDPDAGQPTTPQGKVAAVKASLQGTPTPPS